MVNEGRGRLFRRKDGKYLLYLPVDFCTDSQFPFKNFEKSPRGADSIAVKVCFSPKPANTIIVTKWEEQ